MRRREFIVLVGGASAAWPFSLHAQQGDSMRRVGILLPYASSDLEAERYTKALMEGLRKLGWIRERNIHIEERFGAGDVAQMRAYAAELISLKADVIFAANTPSLAILKQETRSIPIVFANIADPVGSGLVQSLAHPGGNLTGFTNFEPQIGSKWLEVLKELSPSLDNIAAIYNPAAAPYASTYLSSIQRAAPSYRVKIEVRGIEDVGAIENTIASIGNSGSSGLIVLPDAFTATNRAPIIAAAELHSVPAIYPYSVFVKSGGLASYGPDPAEQYRQVATYIDRILKGANPADLPVQEPTKFELVINLKTAQTLKLTVPLTLEAAADEVIE